MSNPDNYFPSGAVTQGSSIIVTGDSSSVIGKASAGMLSQDVVAAESATVMVSEPATVNGSSGRVLIITEADEESIKISLCTSSSANLNCVSQ